VILIPVCLTAVGRAAEEQATMEKATELRITGKPAEALAVLSRVVEASPENVGALLQMGAVFEDLGKWKQAERCLRRVLEMDRDNPDALRNLERLPALREVNAPPKAFKVSGEVLLGRGIEALERRDYDEALRSFRLLRGLRPRDPRPLFCMAFAYERRGLNEKAAEMYTRTSKLFPGFVPARINLIILLTEMNARTRASDAARRALDAFPGDHRIRYLARMLGVGMRLSHDQDPGTGQSLTVAR
jgi:Flp pilus assembly protein TadD